MSIVVLSMPAVRAGRIDAVQIQFVRLTTVDAGATARPGGGKSVDLPFIVGQSVAVTSGVPGLLRHRTWEVGFMAVTCGFRMPVSNHLPVPART